MKKIGVLLSVLALIPLLSYGQCSDLFFSEYIEGSSSNKALEIYNPTSAAINLSDYVVYRANNGSPFPTDSIFLRGMLGGDSVYVIGNPSANATISAQLDTTHSLTFYNGDDAVYMIKISTGDTLDIIGVVGVDPGSGWTVGSGATNNTTLVRKLTVFSGQLDWSTGVSEWDVFPIDMSDSLGGHTKNTCPTPVIDLVITEINYNPAAVTDSMEFIEVYNNGSTVVDMSGYTFTQAVAYTFPSVTINPGAFIVIARDSAATNSRHGISSYQWASGENLSNTTEIIVLKDNLGNTIDSVDYDDGSPWPVGPPSPDGGGPSIELTDVSLDNNLASSWTISTTTVTGVIENGLQVYATPGAFPSAAMRLNVTVDSVVTCNGGADGVIDVTVINGVLPISYLWSNADTTSSISGLGVGTYTITVTDASMATVTGSYVITEPSAINIIVTVDSNVSCNGLADGGLTATATGGTGNLNYAWNVVSSPLSSQSFESTAADTWTFAESPASYNTEGDSIVNGSDDVWAVIEEFTGDIDTASNGLYFWGMQDIENTNGGGAFYHTLTFDPIDVSAESGVKFAFDYYSIGFDGSDSIEYQIKFDNGTTWDNNGTSVNKNSQAWTTIEVSVPDSASFVRVRLQAKQNGSTDYAGFDNVRLFKAANTITDLAAGSYTVTVTDSLGCSAVMAATITEPTLMVASAVVDSNVSVNGGADGGATASATGGTAPYTYLWSNTATTPSFAGVGAGSYFVTITDANGCFDSSSVVITQPATIVVTVTNDSNVTCNGFANGGASLTATGGAMPYTYLWSNGATTAGITGVVAATYSVTVTDNSGSVANGSVTITEPASLVVSVVVDSNVTVNGGSDGGVTVSAAGGTTPYTYLWSSAATTASITGVMAGTYTATVTDANGCTATSTATIAEPAAIMLSGVVTNVTCNAGNDGAIDLTVANGTAPLTYSWSNGEVTEDIDTLVAGTYSVTVTDGNMITTTAAYTVTEPSAININVVVNSNVSCNGGTDGALTATATGGSGSLSYQWNAGNRSLATQSFESSATDNWSFVMNPGTYNTEGDSIVAGSDDVWAVIEEFTGNIDTASNGQYFWGMQDIENGNGGGAFYHTLTFNAIDVSMETGVKFAFDYYSQGYDQTDSIEYQVQFDNGTNWDSNGVALNKNSQAWTTVTIDVPDTANFVRVRLQAKQNGSSDYGAFDNVQLFTGSSAIAGVGAGSYTVTVTDSLGCVSTATGTVTEPIAITASLIATDATTIGGADGSITAIVAGGTAPYTYNWSPSLSGGPNVTGLVAGTYTVTITDANGCSIVDSAMVSDPAAVILVTDSSNVSCFGLTDGTAKVTATGGSAPYTYVWNNGSTTDSIGGLSAGTYTVVVMDNAGTIAIDSVQVIEPLAIQLAFAVTNASAAGVADGAIDLTVSGGTTPFFYNWGSGITTEDLTGLLAGTYTVIVTDANGCSATGSDQVLEPGALANLVITEINYNGPESGTDTSEYIEFTNVGSTTINLNGYTFPQGVTHTFTSNDSIIAGQYFVIAFDSSAFINRYGFNADAIWTAGGLSNGGEDIIITDNFGRGIDTVDFDDNAPWPVNSGMFGPDGNGSSIELYTALTADNNNGMNWVASSLFVPVPTVNGFQVFGTPGNPFTTGINTAMLTEGKLNIYPNPTKGMITIERANDDLERIQLISIEGKVLNDIQSTQNTFVMDLSDYSNGVYFLKIGSTTQRIVLAR